MVTTRVTIKSFQNELHHCSDAFWTDLCEHLSTFFPFCLFSELHFNSARTHMGLQLWELGNEEKFTEIKTLEMHVL